MTRLNVADYPDVRSLLTRLLSEYDRPEPGVGDAAAGLRLYLQHQCSPNTIRAYEQDWERFRLWCRLQDLPCLPASPYTLLVYLADAATATDPSGSYRYASTTITRWVSSVSMVHRAHRHDSPATIEVRRLLRGIRKLRPERPRTERRVVTNSDLDRMLDSVGYYGWPDGVKARRDRLVLLLAARGGLGREAQARLTLEDVTLTPDGVLRLRTYADEQDQLGMTRIVHPSSTHDRCCSCAYVRWRRCVDAFDLRGLKGGRDAQRREVRIVGHVCTTWRVRQRSGLPLLRGVNRHAQPDIFPLTPHSVGRIVSSYAPPGITTESLVLAELDGGPVVLGTVPGETERLDAPTVLDAEPRKPQVQRERFVLPQPRPLEPLVEYPEGEGLGVLEQPLCDDCNHRHDRPDGVLCVLDCRTCSVEQTREMNRLMESLSDWR